MKLKNSLKIRTFCIYLDILLDSWYCYKSRYCFVNNSGLYMYHLHHSKKGTKDLLQGSEYLINLVHAQTARRSYCQYQFCDSSIGRNGER